MAHTDSPAAGRVLWADFLKSIALCGVVLIHSAAPLLAGYEDRGAASWWAGNLYDSAARWCIPVLFMLSGAFLIDKAQTLGTSAFLRRRLGRIGAPFLAWSALYCLWHIEINGVDMAYRACIGAIFQGPVYYHLWFFYVLIGLYLITPLLGAYFESARRSNVAYFLILWALFGSLLPTIEALRGRALSVAPGSLYSLVRYIGFFVLGHTLRNVRCSARQCVWWVLAFMAGWAITALGTWRLTLANGGTFSGALYEYYSPNVAVMAAAVFLVIKSVPYLNESGHSPVASAIVTGAGASAPGVYLIHAMVIAALQQGMIGGVRISPYMAAPWLGVVLFAIIVIALSGAAVVIARRIPGLRIIMP
jgi:surface polysaccharide O-acyltransferase-like enzyme